MHTQRKLQTHKRFYGSTTMGEKGQIVIPAEARSAMDLKKGDKLLVFGMGCDVVAFAKLSQVEQFAKHLAERLEGVTKILKENNK